MGGKGSLAVAGFGVLGVKSNLDARVNDTSRRCLRRRDWASGVADGMSGGR